MTLVRGMALAFVVTLVACSSERAEDPPAVGPLTFTDDGPTVSAITTDEHDSVLGPIDIDGVAFTLTIPSIAIEPGVEVRMTPVTVAGGPSPGLGTFRFEPDGTQFTVPAILEARGVPAGAMTVLRVGNDGLGATLTLTPSADGVATAPIEHFSLAGIFEDPKRSARVTAAGLNLVPLDPDEAAPLVAEAFHRTVEPTLAGAARSLADYVFARRVLGEWEAAIQRAGLAGRKHPALDGLDGRSFGDLVFDSQQRVLAAALALYGELSRAPTPDDGKPHCHDATGKLLTPRHWIEVLTSFLADEITTFGGDEAVPMPVRPCITLSLPADVRDQGAVILRTEPVIELIMALQGTAPTGITSRLLGKYTIVVDGAIGPAKNPIVIEDVSETTRRMLLQRAGDCLDRAHTVTVTLEAELQGGVNLDLAPATGTFTWTDIGRCPCFDPPPPALPGLLPGPPPDDEQCEPGHLTTPTGAVAPANDALQTVVPAMTGGNATAMPLPLGVVYFASRADAVRVCTMPPTQMAGTVYIELLITGEPGATELVPGDYPFSAANTMVPGTFTAFAVGVQACTTLPDGSLACQCQEAFVQFANGTLTLFETANGLVGDVTLTFNGGTSSGSFALPTCRVAFADAPIDGLLRDCIPPP